MSGIERTPLPPPPAGRGRRHGGDRRSAPMVLPLLLVFVLAAAGAAVEHSAGLRVAPGPPASPPAGLEVPAPGELAGGPDGSALPTAPVEPAPAQAAEPAREAGSPGGAAAPPEALAPVPGLPSVTPPPRSPGASAAAGRPTPQPAASPHPLGRPQPAPPEPGPSSFLQTQPDGVTPIAYDPCRPLRYVVNSRTAPPQADGLLAEALATISAVSGLQLHMEGGTDEAPSATRASFQPDRYGDRWAPILIAWSDPAESPSLVGDVAGTAGSVSIRSSEPGPAVYVTGTVTLDGPQLAEMLAAPDGAAAVRGVLLHELGHLIGLGHVDAPDQLMHAYGTQHDLQSGDLAGLVRLGTGPCVPAL